MTTACPAATMAPKNEHDGYFAPGVNPRVANITNARSMVIRGSYIVHNVAMVGPRYQSTTVIGAPTEHHPTLSLRDATRHGSSRRSWHMLAADVFELLSLLAGGCLKPAERLRRSSALPLGRGKRIATQRHVSVSVWLYPNAPNGNHSGGRGHRATRR